MSGLLAAAYSQVYALAVELSVCRYLDPRSLDADTTAHNTALLAELNATLLPCLQWQNDRACTALSLELAHLLKNAWEVSKMLLRRVRAGPGSQCSATPNPSPNQTYSVEFYGNYTVDVSLYLINDIEIFLRRINSVFYCMSYIMGLKGLNRALGLLGQFRGISPIPDPRLYVTSVPCWRCIGELMVLPNHGNPSTSNAAHVRCSHVSVPVNPEPVSGLFENEVRQLGLQHLLEGEKATESESGVCTRSDASAGSEGAMHELDVYSVFSAIPPEVAELSELLYWNSGGNSPGLTREEESGNSRLSSLFAKEQRLRRARRACEATLVGAPHTHLFDSEMPRATERLFCSGVYSSTGDVVEALKADCAAAFTSNPQYQAIIQKRNELYTRLNKAMQRLHHRQDEIEAATETHPYAAIVQDRDPLSTPRNAFADALKRKEQYLRQVASEGLSKLQSCLSQQSETLTENLCLRVWGDVVYQEMASMRNHFLYREAFVNRPWEDMRVPTATAFENSKYIKTHLFIQTLSAEHLHALTHNLYTFITGPLAEEHGLFPLPSNVALARCCDAAGTLPHQKVFFTSLIWPGIEPSDWIETSFNSFYNVRDVSLAKSQQILCRYIREAVLTVSLYNKTWGRTLHLRRADTVSPGQAWPADGLYLTYEADRPLILVYKARGWIFKDLYALLYLHLQMVQDDAE
uniref:DNA polymerase n=1 Tax=Hylobates lar lymphocryptovirus 1 TaxID=230176 RepID=F0J897_9GAMA|nr:DNA polymerase [Hylobates lar lymphocryptovirus 1]